MEGAETLITCLNPDMLIGHQAAELMEDDVVITKDMSIRKDSCKCLTARDSSLVCPPATEQLQASHIVRCYSYNVDF